MAASDAPIQPSLNADQISGDTPRCPLEVKSVHPFRRTWFQRLVQLVARYIAPDRARLQTTAASKDHLNLQDLLAPVDAAMNIDVLLESWRWLVPRGVTPLAVTAFGDLFLVASSGAVLFLDTVRGTCDEVADSVEDWERKILQDSELLEKWFMPGFLNVLRAADKQLSQGQCYSTRQFIALGGAFTVENWDPTDWEVHFCYAGELHKALKDLPPGTKVTGIKFTPL